MNVSVMSCRRMVVIITVCGALFVAAAQQVSAQSNIEAETAIRGALLKWMAAFNARDTTHVCDLFAADLLYDYRGFPERNFAFMCGLLHQSLNDRTKTFSYSPPDIKEIIVSGNLAVVRLIWTVTITSAAGSAEETKEHGIDIFRKQPGETWQIARFIGYDAP